MDRAIRALRVVFLSSASRCRAVCLLAVRRIGYVLLGHCGQVHDRIGYGVRAPKGDDDAWRRGRVRQGHVAARVREKRPGVPGLEEGQRLARIVGARPTVTSSKPTKS